MQRLDIFWKVHQEDQLYDTYRIAETPYNQDEVVTA